MDVPTQPRQKILIAFSLNCQRIEVRPNHMESIVSNTPHKISIGLTTKDRTVRQRRDPLSDHLRVGAILLVLNNLRLWPQGQDPSHQPTPVTLDRITHRHSRSLLGSLFDDPTRSWGAPPRPRRPPSPPRFAEQRACVIGRGDDAWPADDVEPSPRPPSGDGVDSGHGRHGPRSPHGQRPVRPARRWMGAPGRPPWRPAGRHAWGWGDETTSPPSGCRRSRSPRGGR